MHIPVNRWTVGLMAAIALFFGNDIVAPILKVVAILTASHTPAY